MVNLLVRLQPCYNLFHFWRVVSADLTKGLKELYSADGQIVIPLVSLTISQPGNQLVDAHTKLHERYILSHSGAEEKFHGCELPRRKSTGGQWLKICTTQPWTIFFSSFFTYVLHHCISYLLSVKKIKIQAFEKLQIIWNIFWTFIFKWAAAAASVASDRFGAKLIIPHKKALLSLLTQGWLAG